MLDTNEESQHGVWARAELARLIAALERADEPAEFEWRWLSDFRHDNKEAQQILVAACRPNGRSFVDFRGEVASSLHLLDDFAGDVLISGAVRGDVRVQSSISNLDVASAAVVEGDLIVAGPATVSGNLTIHGSVGSSCRVRGRIDGHLRVLGAGRVGGNLDTARDAVVGKGVAIGDQGRVGGSVRIEPGNIGGVLLSEDAVVGGDLRVKGAIRWVLLDRRAAVERDIDIDAEVSDRVLLGPDTKVGRVRVGSTVGDGVEAYGTARGVASFEMRSPALALGGHFMDGVAVVPPEGTNVALRTVRGARFERPVHLGDRVSIASCDFRQCGDLDEVDLVGGNLFEGADGAPVKALLNPPDGSEERVPDGEMASIYRQLRVNLEGKGNRPASAFFYRGEMDSRRRAARSERRWGEWGWLGLYRLVAGYGLRVAPPLLWFLALVGIGGVALHGLDLDRDWPGTFVYTAQAMLSLFRPPDPSGDWRVGLVQIVLRILGPILLGLAAFAVRDKVAR